MDKNNLVAMRHTAEHILHQAIKELYPQIQLAMGPPTDEGFYFDFDASPEKAEPVKISEEDFPKIEKRMRELVNLDLPLTRMEISEKEARKLFKGNPYKLEWVDGIVKKSDKITIYWTGQLGEKNSMVDLCKGPHVASTGKVGPFKLLSVAGAYWHGSEKNKMLTRIYGTCFFTKEELDKYLWQQEEAKKRDHRKLGKELDLFVFSDLVGKGLPMLTAKGATIKRILERFIVDEEIKRGYQHVYTPALAKVDLYRTSGHYPYYKGTMYPPMIVDEEELILRPMTCPHHFALFKTRPRSYHEMPVRFAEISPQYRYEKSGELSGLMRIRIFMLADAHIMTPVNQAKSEIIAVLDLIDYINHALGLKKGKDYLYRLSLCERSDTKKYYKDDLAWDKAEKILREVLKEIKAPYYEAPNEAAFYGPKIDVQIKNVAGKEETAFTVQYDFVMPKRFALKFINSKGQEEEPIVIHRSSIGALERTIAFLIEKYAGAFPLWLSPVQVAILPVSDKFQDYALKIKEELEKRSIRTELNNDSKTLGAKIREATLQKIPYMVIIGEKESQSSVGAKFISPKMISVRTREGKDLGQIKITQFISKLKAQIEKFL
ncbi:threonine--tRNA ligase [Candidatus Roizmanbacteria bacterium CG_4_10_14_0_2_um_filter_36_35]|uniref:Threonine--tRNA ligase n=4 Tax=Candidatus Roizmaniibacteriota TaxID=1752723 RepID=A0A2M7BW79_9BACT|nr:MAG: threonine--tRNA ligase [Candidatus Roizmanbacteria bacterium CG11_big_fil_rev_8_21_14_0_20_35_14]PIV10843.1 MAG: threonine--tRNA ligase [Candidatus Roizmanbacteria bacterium CG03_land_8_20_14_0_80_35_26]PIZ67241.1 MAG: threonine--tRNA ligase [Candidatus Roizmanbacteria bacterium CG_4_10_14_0_2_um_filter_36_35]PJC31113.1 MAG: threonine--tRNA ligase [Candidatus Roizmanbacteria bacterium CG_4_9_14_0_2_um_filter_36_12]PJC79981.1 MAG: threonine--tRNA ligase [Candidatus Roizmanbacteria bacter